MTINREEPIFSTYLHEKGARFGIPISGNFELTAGCNFRCPMCYVREDSASCREKELTTAQWLGLAEEAVRQGMVFALLTGGEPLIRRDFFEILRGMKRLGLLVTINTNGSLIDREAAMRFAEDPPLRVNISLYGTEDSTYLRMCGQPCREKVLDGIRLLKQAGIDVRLNVSLTEENADDFDGILRTARELGVHIKASAYMYPPVRVGKDAASSCRLDPDRAAALTVAYDRFRLSEESFRLRAGRMKEIARRTDGAAAGLSKREKKCRAGRTGFWITWDGRMLPCGLMTAPVAYPLKVGFTAAWEQIKRETARITLPDGCRSCPKRDACFICAAICSAETGGYRRSPEYVCRMTESVMHRMADAAACGVTQRENAEETR